MSKFIKRFRELTEEIERNPENIQAYYDRGFMVYSYECDFENNPYQDEDEEEDEWFDISEDSAIVDFNKIIELKPDYTQAYSIRALLYLEKAIYLNQEEGFELALADIDKALSLDRNCAEAYLAKGIYYADKDEAENAIQFFSKTIEIDSSNLTAYKKRANIYTYTEGKSSEAIEDYSRIIELKAGSFEIYKERGEIYVEVEKYKEAIEDFNIALTLPGEDWEKVFVYLARADAYDDLGEQETSLSDYDKAVGLSRKINSCMDAAYASRASFYKRQKQYENRLPIIH